MTVSESVIKVPGVLRVLSGAVLLAVVIVASVGAKAWGTAPDSVVIPGASSGIAPAVSSRNGTKLLTSPAAETRQEVVAVGQRAQLTAIRQAIISSELAGKIVSMRFREGERFSAGATLTTFDSALYAARLERAVQAERAADKKFRVAQELKELGSISTSDYEQARAAVAVAAAESRVERVMVNRCTIAAPFAGRVGETFVRASEHVSEGEKLLSIYDDSAFELETIVPSAWLAWLRPGYPLSIAVEETGMRYRARVSRIAGVIDPVSQSVKVVALLENSSTRRGTDVKGVPLMHGMSGMVYIAPPAQDAARSESGGTVPPSDTEGRL